MSFICRPQVYDVAPHLLILQSLTQISSPLHLMDSNHALSNPHPIWDVGRIWFAVPYPKDLQMTFPSAILNFVLSTEQMVPHSLSWNTSTLPLDGMGPFLIRTGLCNG